MRGTALFAALLAACAVVCPSAGHAEETVEAENLELETMDEMVSYQMGFQMGESISWMDQGGIDLDIIIAGIRDGVAGRVSRLPQYEHQSVMTEIYERSAAAATAQHEALAERNLEETEEFLKDNAKREGVIETESGLQYEMLEDYEGPTPGLGARVLLHFTIEDLSGTVYKSTYDADSPTETILTNLIEGWQEGIQLMSVGDRYRFYIPPDLSYGSDGGPHVEPNGVMVSTIELLSIYEKKSEEDPSGGLPEQLGD